MELGLGCSWPVVVVGEEQRRSWSRTGERCMLMIGVETLGSLSEDAMILESLLVGRRAGSGRRGVRGMETGFALLGRGLRHPLLVAL